MAVDPGQRSAAVARLVALRETGQLSAARVRLAAEGLGVSARTVRRWIEPGASPAPLDGEQIKQRHHGARLVTSSWPTERALTIRPLRASPASDGRDYRDGRP